MSLCNRGPAAYPTLIKCSSKWMSLFPQLRRKGQQCHSDYFQSDDFFLGHIKCVCGDTWSQQCADHAEGAGVSLVMQSWAREGKRKPHEACQQQLPLYELLHSLCYVIIW